MEEGLLNTSGGMEITSWMLKLRLEDVVVWLQCSKLDKGGLRFKSTNSTDGDIGIGDGADNVEDDEDTSMVAVSWPGLRSFLAMRLKLSSTRSMLRYLQEVGVELMKDTSQSVTMGP